VNTNTLYTFRLSTEERDMVRELARGAYRKDGEVMRVLIRGAYEALKEYEEQENRTKATRKELQAA
jgi:hypothetical protein